jgi:hypothetical protein
MLMFHFWTPGNVRLSVGFITPELVAVGKETVTIIFLAFVNGAEPGAGRIVFYLTALFRGRPSFMYRYVKYPR